MFFLTADFILNKVCLFLQTSNVIQKCVEGDLFLKSKPKSPASSKNIVIVIAHLKIIRAIF